MNKLSTITGAEVKPGDVIRSAAMPEPLKVSAVSDSGTGRTVEVRFGAGTYARTVRIGKASKVKRYNYPAASIKVDGVDDNGERYDNYDDNPWAGTITVQANYYGTAYQDDTTREWHHIGWVVEFAGDERNAERIVRNADRISAVVEANGRRQRVRVTFSGREMTVADYDHGRWSVTVPAGR